MVNEYNILYLCHKIDELDAICEEASIATCDACIRADPRCSWCVQGRLGAKIKRCRAAT